LNVKDSVESGKEGEKSECMAEECELVEMTRSVVPRFGQWVNVWAKVPAPVRCKFIVQYGKHCSAVLFLHLRH